MPDLFLDLYKTIESRKTSKRKNSYTKKLFKEGEKNPTSGSQWELSIMVESKKENN